MTNTNTQKGAIQLINVYSTNNIGDAAIYASIASLANNRSVVLPNYQQNTAANHQKLASNIVAASSQQSIAVKLSVGGDIFNNARPRLITKQFLKNISQLMNRPKNTLVFGQSIPRSCKGIAFRLLTHSLSKLSNVCVRDQESFDRLSQAGLNPTLSYDFVLSQTLNSAWVSKVTKVLSGEVDFSEVALVSLRPFDAMYQYNSEACVAKLIKLCKLLAKQGYIPTIMVHARVNGRDADMALVNTINQHCPIKILDPFLISQRILKDARKSGNNKQNIAPWQVGMAITALAELVIGIRYHSSIFRLASGKLPYNIFYSNKGEDLCKRLKVPGVSIQDFNPEEHINDVLSTANKTFDNKGIKRQIKKDFDKAVTCAELGREDLINSVKQSRQV